MGLNNRERLERTQKIIAKNQSELALGSQRSYTLQRVFELLTGDPDPTLRIPAEDARDMIEQLDQTRTNYHKRYGQFFVQKALEAYNRLT